MNDWGMWWGEFQGRHGFRLRRPSMIETDWSHAHPSFGQANRLLDQTSTLPGQNQGQKGLSDDFPPLSAVADRAYLRQACYNCIQFNSRPNIARAPEPLIGNERSPPHSYGIPVLAAPLPGIHGRREAASHRSSPGGAGPRPARRDHLRPRGAAERSGPPGARRSIPAGRQAIREVSRVRVGRDVPSRRRAEERRGGRGIAGACLEAALARAEPAPLPCDSALDLGGAETLRAR